MIVQPMLELFSWWETHLPPPEVAWCVFAQLQPWRTTDRKFALTWKCQLFYQLSAWVWQRTKWELDTWGGFSVRQLLGLMPNTEQRRRGDVFAKGNPPHGLWLGPKLLDKEPQRWYGQSTSTKWTHCSEGGKYWVSVKTIFKITINSSPQMKVCFPFPFLFF